MSRAQYTSPHDETNVSEYALGRTALTVGLRMLGLKSGDVLLAPDYLCDVVWHGAARAGVIVAPFPLSDDLTPVWSVVESLAAQTGARALLMVHYFGQPQDVERHRALCADRKLFLVEDNAHGYGGTLHGKMMGTLGDIGIASPRKIIGTRSGGLLFAGSGAKITSVPIPLTRTKNTNVARLARAALSRFPRIKSRVRGLLDLNKDWSDPRLYREQPAPDDAIDPASSRKIAATDWAAVARARRAAWDGWTQFAVGRGLKPVFVDAHPESCPWALPVYARDESERDRWLRWGARHGVTMFTWPALPESLIAPRQPALERWKKTLCFSLDRAP